MTLADGAVQLPTSHVSVRVPWHDTDWTGRVCRAPGQNHACTALKNIKEKKLFELEDEDAGRPWDELAEDRVPPCALERAGFMRASSLNLVRKHAYAWSDRTQFAPTTQHMRPYSLEVTPFRWVMRDQAPAYAATWGIGFDQGLEDRADEILNFSADWVQDHRNQLALLDSFFSALRPRASLVLLYAKDVPLVEQPVPGERFLIGAGFVDEVRPVVEWEYEEIGPLRSVMWERGVAHSIRPSCIDGFLLPYQQLLADPDLQGEDLERFVARAPSEHFDEFSYVSELVSHDGAIAALTELARILELLPGIVPGPWETASGWVGDRLADAWRARGPYPGLGSMLVAAGLDRGPVVADRALNGLGEDVVNPWPVLEQAIEDNTSGLVGRMGRKAWLRLVSDADRYRQLRLMSRFALTSEQARRLFESLAPADVMDNPYRIFELDRGEFAPITFSTVDRGVWPQDAQARAALDADPMPEPITEAGDDRRVRAASVHVLERAADQGHTVLDEPGLRRKLSALDLAPPCDPPDAVFELAVEEFDPLLVERGLARDAGRAWQLDRLAATTARIASEVRRRLEEAPLDTDWNLRERIDDVIGETLPSDPALREIEEQARHEKAQALGVLARSRVSVLIGPAGTGKTTMLEALCSDPAIQAGGVLLLAPTGKARVQLSARVDAPAQTVAQFLRPHRWDELGYRLAPGAPVEHGFRTVVIDEASMLTEEMFAATLDALADVERLVLCGDPRQLPPIGAGRPFVDLVAFLREAEGSGGGVAELTVGRRQLPAAGEVGRTRDDVAIASMFSLDAVLQSADEALARAFADESDPTFRLVTWDDEPDLHRKVVEVLCEEDLQLSDRDAAALMRSLGATQQGGDRPRFAWGSAGQGAERWQLLSPVRARPGGVAGLNQLIRATWRGGDATLARRSWKFAPPMGADEVIFNDKIMCLRNDNKREAYEPLVKATGAGSVANGEIGVVVWGAGKKGKRPTGLKVEFSTQEGRQYTFWDWELNSEGEAGEILELAYAVTVHKSQGSQFGTTVVIVPDPCPLLSPELLYTALTRQRGRVVLFKQGEASTLRSFASPSRSETARRLTCLFRPADPFTTSDGVVLDGAHVHRTLNGELVLSKSEVIVANTLHNLGVDYGYEVELRMWDGTWRLPDFTVRRPGHKPVYWEHLGMLDRPGYAADWRAKKQWYASHGILPWEDGGGTEGTLVCSTERHESDGIDAQAIDALAREVFGL